MEEYINEMGKELSDLKLIFNHEGETIVRKHKTKRTSTREGKKSCHYGKFVYGIHTMQETIQIL